MEESRLALDAELRELLDSRYCYFQPPESLKLHYPCYVYERAGSDVLRADNGVYRKVPRYNLTYITPDPDDPLVDLTEDHFTMCRFDRSFAVDNLNHYNYDLYYS